MIAPRSISLVEYVRGNYAVSHDLEPGSVYQLERSARIFEEWNGGPADLTTVTDDRLSLFLMQLRDRFSQTYIRKIRGDLITLLRDAAEVGLCNEPAKVRRIAKPRPRPRAYTLEQAEKIIRECLRLPGVLSDGIPRSTKIAAMGLAAWDTAFRRSDLRRLQQSDIADDGRIAITQKKTGELIVGAVRPSSLAIIRRCGPFPCRYPGTWRSFYWWFKKAIAAAGVQYLGSLKAFRKSAATDVARFQPGAETRLLGHTTPAADVHYVDRSLVMLEPVRPTALNVSIDPQGWLF